MAVLLIVGVVGAVVGLTGTAVGAGQKSKAMKLSKQMAITQNQQNALLSDRQNNTQIEIGINHDVGSVISSVIKTRLDNEATITAAARAATMSKQGDLLIMVGAGITVLSLAVLVFRRKKQT